MSDVMKPADVTTPTDPKAIRDIIERAQKGDEKVLPALRKLLHSPDLVERLGGNLAVQVEHSLIRAAAGKNLAFREAVLSKMDMMRTELAGPEPTPLERLLVERVITCWVQVQLDDIRLAQNEAKLTLAQGEYQDRSRPRPQTLLVRYQDLGHGA
jgi:hypothetical protein